MSPKRTVAKLATDVLQPSSRAAAAGLGQVSSVTNGGQDELKYPQHWNCRLS